MGLEFAEQGLSNLNERGLEVSTYDGTIGSCNVI